MTQPNRPLVPQEVLDEIRLLLNHARERQVENVGEYARGCCIGARYECEHCKAHDEYSDVTHKPDCPLATALRGVESFLDNEDRLHQENP